MLMHLLMWLLLIAALYLLGLFAVAWLSLHPFRTPFFISPGAMGQPQEDVQFASSDGTLLRGWWTEPADAQAVAILSHGYVMNRCELTPLAVWLSQRGFATLVYDFRAHGNSGGRKSGLGWTERKDVVAAAQWARRRISKAKIVLIGSSMGASASAFALKDCPGLADCLILDSAYSQMHRAISGWWRFLGGRWLSWLLSPCVAIAAPLAGFNPFRIDVAKALTEIDLPVLLIHGDCDNLATPNEALRNQKSCGGIAEVVWMPNCGHSEGRWVHPEAYYRSIEGFLSEHGFRSLFAANKAKPGAPFITSLPSF